MELSVFSRKGRIVKSQHLRFSAPLACRVAMNETKKNYNIVSRLSHTIARRMGISVVSNCEAVWEKNQTFPLKNQIFPIQTRML